jgi:FlaA1/EpsC-like NDP-sugar epimerase
MAGKIEEARTVAVSLAAATHTKVKKVPIQVTPETEKTNRPEATHSLIVAVGHVIAEKQLTRETVNHPTKTLLQDLRQVKIQDLREVKIQDLREVKIQDLREVKSPRLGRQAKRARKPKFTRWFGLQLAGFAYVGPYSRFALPEVHGVVP